MSSEYSFKHEVTELSSVTEQLKNCCKNFKKKDIIFKRILGFAKFYSILHYIRFV